MMEGLLQDLRYGARMLLRSPGFALVAVLSLAIGVGATTAIFTIANALLLKPVPGIGEPERLVDVGRTENGQGFDTFSYPNYLDVRAQARTLDGFAVVNIEPRAYSLDTGDGVAPVQGSPVSGNFFQVLRARPAIGRFFVPEEDRLPSGTPVVVVSHRFWRETLGGDPAAVGSTLRLNGTAFTVVGVASEGFHGPYITAPDFWVPLTATRLLGMPADLFSSRESVWLTGVARLAAGVTLETAQAEVGGIAHRLQQAFPEENRGKGLRVAPSGLFPGEMKAAVQGFLGLLFAVAALVLLIASTNVAGMLLARGAMRRREVAVRLSLGAGRGRLMRQLATESVLLFVIAGAVGVLLAQWMSSLLVALLPPLPFPVAFDPVLDWRVLGFALAMSLAAGLTAGLVPAGQATRLELVGALKTDAGAEGWRRLRLRSGLVVAQLAFSLLLLVGAGLFLRALVHARAIDPGFEPHGVELSSLDLGLANLEQGPGRAFANQLVERAAALPGVEAAAMALDLPLDGGSFGLGALQVQGRQPPPGPDGRVPEGWDADWNVVTPGYLGLLRIPLVEGRDFTAADRDGAPDVAIINQTLAQTLWPGQSAIGKTFGNDGRVVTVIGVSRDAKNRSLSESPRGFVYVPLAQRYWGRMTLLVRLADGQASVAGTVRRIVGELHPALPVVDQQTLSDYTAMALFPQRVALYVAGSLGIVALLLAVLGIYGVTAYTVASRTRELGIRLALGAERGRVVRLVLREGVGLATIGAGVGLLGAAAVTRLLSGMLYGVSATDPVAFGGGALLLVGAALVASWVPARRAARVDPMVALRAE